MGDDHHRQPQLPVELLEQVEDGVCGLGVQGGGGLVTQQHLGVVGQGPGDGHPLLLAAGELAGIGVLLVCDVHQSQQPADLLGHLPLGKAAAPQGIGHISEHGAGGHQVEMLKDHADLFSGLAQLGGAQAGHLPAVHHHAALSGPLQQIDTPHQGGLARPGKADDAEYLPLPDLQGDILHRVHRVLRRAEGL